MRTVMLQPEAAAGGDAARAAFDPLAECAELDLAELYRVLSKRLERIVRLGVRAPDPLIEDACQFAWTRLVDHQDHVRTENALAWLVKTAVREAFKLVGRGCREHSLDAELDVRGEILAPDPSPGPADRYEQRERLRAISTLSPRQQRLLWLYGLGLSYEEIATHDGCSARTVERQLQRARATLRDGVRPGPESVGRHSIGAQKREPRPRSVNSVAR
jgi:RNA polymerase sigma factor (sigma-70 family)